MVLYTILAGAFGAGVPVGPGAGVPAPVITYLIQSISRFEWFPFQIGPESKKVIPGSQAFTS